jgi:hypothetical protein
MDEQMYKILYGVCVCVSVFTCVYMRVCVCMGGGEGVEGSSVKNSHL